MTDLKIEDIRRLSQESRESINYFEESYKYKDSYESFNLKILEKARLGENSIRFDFVDDDIEKSTKPKKDLRRIYLSTKGGFAEYDMFDYPMYLLSKGFKVEVMKSQKRHGYVSKSYLISW